ncbi:glycosyl hydrolase family 28-related protein [Cereibacter changlensis]|uniref:glycosyl hydrolase family 28-related protein n=1 Tax=Cereibacter changlensis TaxID=402884 RepID=UPI0040342454
MNMAITDGLVLMPPAFAAGLALWSRGDGVPGSGSYAGQPNAALVAADADFGGCLELQKTEATQKLRCFQQIPLQPGLYLRVTARVKAVAGALPAVRIAGWAGRSDGTNLASAVQVGPSVALSSYGEVVTVTAIVGAGNRQGVDMVWGGAAVYGHFGLDLTGANGGIVRIDDISIEDATPVFQRKLLALVDVRDHGAVGDGATDDTAAFLTADAEAAATGRELLVSAGTYRVEGHLTLNARVRFEGRLSMPAESRLACTRNFDLDSYASAFGSETAGFAKALQALFYFSDHVALDLGGRRVDLAGPVDVAALAGLTSFAQRRLLTNGQLNAVPGDAWATETVSSHATYSTSAPTRLTGVVNVAAVPVGALVSGAGVGREVYVLSKNVGAGTIELSLPPSGLAGRRSFGFTRYKYMLDFSGFASLSKFEVTDVELQCNGEASAILLPMAGSTFRLADAVINKPKDRGVTSAGSGCQGLFIDQCQFLSNEQPARAQDRSSIGLNVNSNDVKIRDNRVVRFAHFAILNGTGHMLIGNHIFQGDDETAGLRRAGIVFTQTNTKSLVTGNYIDNCFLEWSNEHDPAPGYASEYSFGGLTVSDNIFTTTDVAGSFCWFVLAPKGAGHFLNGLSLTGNAFRAVNGDVERIDRLDSSVATMDFTRFRNVTIGNNTFNGVGQITASPVTVEHVQNTAATTWSVDASAFLPFGARARNVSALVAEGAITTAAGAVQFVTPYVQVEQGSGGRLVNLRWPQEVKGRMQVTLRCDNPV